MLELQVYLLAGGNGARAGGPKAWRLVDGRSLLERQLEFLKARFAAERIGVTIQAAWLERCQALDSRVRWVPEDPQRPPMAAIQALMAKAPLEFWTFLYHVDMPVWESALFEALAGRIPAAERSGVEALAPVFNGRKGHPLLLSPALRRDMLALDPLKDRMDHWLRARREETVDVPFPCIHENWNGPAGS